MGKFGKSENRTCGQTGHCPAMSGVRQPDGHGHLSRYMSCLSGLGRQRLSHDRPRRHRASITALADQLIGRTAGAQTSMATFRSSSKE